MRPHPIGLPEQVHWIGGVVVVKSGRGSHTLVVLVLVLVLALVPTCYITCVACFVLVSSKQASNWFSLCFSLSVTYPKKCRPAGKKEKKDEGGRSFSRWKGPGGEGREEARRQGSSLFFLSSFSFFSFFFLVSSCSQWVLDKVVWFTPTPYPSQQGSLDVPLTHDDYTTQQGGG